MGLIAVAMITAAAAQADDSFTRLKKARAMENFAEGDTLVTALPVSPHTLTPLVSVDVYAVIVQGYVLDSLAVRDPETLSWLPHLAERWEVSNDGLVITFMLRPDVRFSDGRLMSSDDVVFTFNLIMNPQVNAIRHRTYYSLVREVEKIDERTVAFRFERPYARAFEVAAGMDVLPRHYYGEMGPEQINRSLNALIGSGPYRLRDEQLWEPGQTIELVRNENYWGVRPGFDRLVYRIIEDEGEKVAAYANGEIDLLEVNPDIIEVLQDEQLIRRSQRFDYLSPASGYRYIGWNQFRNGEPTVFADRRVRQAMTMLADREAIAREILKGHAQVATGPFSPMSAQNNPKIEPWAYDPQRAAELLAEAGFERRDEEGVLLSPEGAPFEFELFFAAGSAEQIVALLQEDYAEAGIRLNPRPVSWPELLQRSAVGDFDAIALGWTGGIELDLYQMFHSDSIEQGDNLTSYWNPRLDAIIEQARETVDEEERMALWRAAHRIIHADQPYTFLVFQKSLVLIDRRIENVQQVRLGLNPVTEWYVPADGQKR